MIKSNSKNIISGDTFIAIKGKVLDGHDFILEAIDNGATELILEHGSYDVKSIIVKDTKKYYSDYLKKEYNLMLKKLKLIGVTGTNGKTTTAFYIYQMLRKLNVKSAFIGTIGFYMDKYIKPLKNTTPSLEETYELLNCAYESNIEYVVMEVSSAALENKRILGLSFDIGIFTNITHDHLDYHENFNNYINCKKILFENIKDSGTAIINVDDVKSNNFLLKRNKNITFGINESDFKIINYKLFDDNVDFKFKYKNEFYEVHLSNPGLFNIYNFLGAVIALYSLSFELKDILPLSVKMTLPPGRYETLVYNGNKIIIDFAHSPDSVTKILSDILKFKKGKLITILGCSGNSDRKKRPLMGEIAVTLSDYVIFTNDNPALENEKDIMNDITNNLKSNNYEIIYDRENAIKKGMTLLNKEDILIILGKGHEAFQIIGKEKIPYNDKFTVLKYMK